MKFVYVTLVNMLLFFFIVTVFSGITVRGGSFLEKVWVGLLFGVFMAGVPHVLKFFKLAVSSGSLLLMGVVMSFIFFFIGIYFLDLFNISRSTVDIGVSFIPEISLQDRTMAIVFLSLVSAIMSIGLEILGKQK
jgi:hypothetical protein